MNKKHCLLSKTVAVLAAAAFVWSSPSYADEAIKIGVLNTVSDLPMYLAEQEGFFKQEGISLTMVPFKSGAQMMAPLGTGQLDAGATIVSAGLFNLSTRGVNLKIVSDRGSQRPGFGYYRLLVRKELVDSGKYKSFSDLKGLKVGTQSKGGSAEVTLNEALKRGGLTFDDVTISYLGHADAVAGLANGAIDAGFVTEPNASIALKQGSSLEVATGDQVDPDGILGVMAFDSTLLEKRRGVAKGFLKAFIRGCRLVNDAYKDGVLQPVLADKVVSVYKTYFSMTDIDLIRSMKPSGCNPDGVPSAASLDKQYAFFKSRGYLEGYPQLQPLLDFSLVKEVVAELGPYKPAN